MGRDKHDAGRSGVTELAGSAIVRERDEEALASGILKRLPNTKAGYAV